MIISSKGSLISLNVITSSFDFVPLKRGNIINAEVLDILSPDRLILGLKNSPYNHVKITAFLDSNIALSRGDILKLKVVALGEEIRLQVIDVARKAEEGLLLHTSLRDPHLDREILNRLSSYLSKMSFQISKGDMKILTDFLKKIPENLKIGIPEFSYIEKLVPEIETLSSKILELSIKNSGLFFENKIRLFFENDIEIKKIIDSDIKGLLLKLRDILKNNQFSELFLQSEVNTKELIRFVETFLKIIEFYQLSSLLNNVLYSYLPLFWDELKDGRILFKKKEDESYNCELSLFLEDFGKVNVSISYLNKSLYVSFYSDNQYFLSLVDANKEELKKRFEGSNISLKAINVIEKKELDLSFKNKDGLNLKI